MVQMRRATNNGCNPHHKTAVVERRIISPQNGMSGRVQRTINKQYGLLWANILIKEFKALREKQHTEKKKKETNKRKKTQISQ